MESSQCMVKYLNYLEQFRSSMLLITYIISVLYIICFYAVTRHLYEPTSWTNRRGDNDEKVEVSRGLFILQLVLLTIPIANMALILAAIIILIVETSSGDMYYENKTTNKPLWITTFIKKIVNWLKKPI